MLWAGVLVGASRKSFIGYTLDLPPAERVEAQLRLSPGVPDILRVHDVEVTRVARMSDAIIRAGKSKAYKEP